MLNATAMLNEVDRVLKHQGVFLMITYGSCAECADASVFNMSELFRLHRCFALMSITSTLQEARIRACPI